MTVVMILTNALLNRATIPADFYFFCGLYIVITLPAVPATLWGNFFHLPLTALCYIVRRNHAARSPRNLVGEFFTFTVYVRLHCTS